MRHNNPQAACHFPSIAFPFAAAIVLLAGIVPASPLAAQQQIHVGVPSHGITDSFFENYGIGFGFNRMGPGGGFFFNNGGGANAAAPPFGGHNPANDFRFGGGVPVGGGNFSFNFAAGQGSSRTISSVTPSVTVMNGTGGFFSDTTIRPFVTGIVPVVGGWPGVAFPPPRVTSPLAERLYRLRTEQAVPHPSPQPPPVLASAPPDPAAPQPAPTRSAAPTSSAARGDMSLADIRRQQDSQQQQLQEERDELIRKGQAAETEGKRVVARIYFEQAARRSSGELQSRLHAKVKSLRAE